MSKLCNTAFSAGDTILLKKGAWWRETLLVSSSGTALNYITYSNYGSASSNPTIDASSIFTDFSATSGGAGSAFTVWKRACQPTQVFENGSRMTQSATLASMTTSCWFSNSTPTLYIWPADGGNPNSNHTIDVSLDRGVTNHSGSCVNMNGKSWIVFDGIDVVKAPVNGYDYQSVDSTSNTIIRNGTCDYNWLRGVGMDRSNLSQNHSNALISNMTSSNCISEGFWLGSGTSITLQNSVTFYSGRDCLIGYPSAGHVTGILFCYCNGGLATGNYIYDVYVGSPMYIEFQSGKGPRSTNVVFSRNTIVSMTTSHQAIFLEGGPGCVFKGNTIISAYTISRGIEFDNGGYSQTVANNLFYGKWKNWCIAWANSMGTNNSFEDNIVYTLNTGQEFLLVQSAGLQGGTVDYNCYYPTVSASYNFEWDPTSTFPSLWTTWQALGNDSHGTNKDPQFISSSLTNFGLQSTSPCRNTGIFLPGINNGYSGSAPDIGPNEFAEPPLNQPAQWGRPATAYGAHALVAPVVAYAPSNIVETGQNEFAPGKIN